MVKLKDMEIATSGDLKFLTKYLKRVLYYKEFGSLENLYDIGTVVKYNDEIGIVVGYCGVGYEYALFEDDRERGYYVRGIEGYKRKINTKNCVDFLSLFVKMNDYLIKNKFRLSTDNFKVCYEHWKRTGEYEFDNPIGDTNYEEIKKLESELKIKEDEVTIIKYKLSKLK